MAPRELQQRSVLWKTITSLLMMPMSLPPGIFVLLSSESQSWRAGIGPSC